MKSMHIHINFYLLLHASSDVFSSSSGLGNSYNFWKYKGTIYVWRSPQALVKVRYSSYVNDLPFSLNNCSVAVNAGGSYISYNSKRNEYPNGKFNSKLHCLKE